MLCHGDIFLLSRSNKNILTCQFLFLCDKKINVFFCVSQISYIQFYIAHWQHVDLLRSGPRNKETFNLSFTVLIYRNSY